VQNYPQVPPEQLQKAREYVAKHRHINWYSDPYQLDESAIVEGILNYGTWDEVKQVFSWFGKKTVADIYHSSTSKSFRHNFHPLVKNYFDLYFAKNA